MVCAFAAALLLGGCGGSDEGNAGEPADAANAYLTAIADNEGQRACDLLTVDARAQIADVGGDTATASVELEGKAVEVELQRVGDEWRIDTFGFAGSLLRLDSALDEGSTSVSAETAEAWAGKWCDVELGMTLSEADEIMGDPTGVFEEQHQWGAFEMELHRLRKQRRDDSST